MNKQFKLFESDYPVCPYKNPSTIRNPSGSVTVKPHPSHARWKRSYKNIEEWRQANPGVLVGKLLTPPLKPSDIVYYSYRRKHGSGIVFEWVITGTELPLNAVVYENYKEWQKASGFVNYFGTEK